MTASAQGEDRSNFQAIGPWNGLDFGWCKATEATSFLDPTFAANWASLRKQVGYRGAYHFFHPGIDATAQAEFFMSAVLAQGLEPGDMLAIDAEIAAGADGTQIAHPNVSTRSALLYADDKGRARIVRGARIPSRLLHWSYPVKISAGIVGSTALTFLNRVASIASSHLGGDYCPVFCYSFTSFLPQLAPCTAYPLWAADFTSRAPATVAPWDRWTMWQYAGGGGQLGADQDAYNGTRADMDTWMHPYMTGRQPAPAPAPKPAPAPTWTETLVQNLPLQQRGSSGDDTRTVQACLTARGYPVTIDGAFGPGTQAAVQRFQASRGLAQDGIVGQNTWTKLLNR